MIYWIYQIEGRDTYWESFRGLSPLTSTYTAMISDDNLGDYLTLIRKELDVSNIYVFPQQSYRASNDIHEAILGDKADYCDASYDSSAALDPKCPACATLLSFKDSHWTTEYFEGVA